MKRGLGLSNKEMGDVFAEWNKGVLDSFLIEITRDIVSKFRALKLFDLTNKIASCTSMMTMARCVKCPEYHSSLNPL
jgi:6-phosphogluconate dehydrogenase